ncbi:hypothetical protein HOLleu_21482 [Holothuria leucospilota]|uniref:Ig-like domain-containing protein n=1 Tax=Holothuria leucospilota TaxID=206669 RepID=A0A9Q1BXZ5_HOLLE|nr:hypothetical protein HOLleu_21482 [Holothuria leucospilota]
MNDSPNLVTLSILKNSSITINCSSSTNSSMTHVWWFNGIIIFANSFQPTEIGISNVQGTYVNSSFSYLRFDGFSQINTGNYTCRDGNTVNKFFMLDIKGKFMPA